MEILRRVLESSSPGTATGEGKEMVFDPIGMSTGGIVIAWFWFTIFRSKDGFGSSETGRIKSSSLV